MAVLTTGASIFVKAFRISPLTESGSVAPGTKTLVSKDVMKLTIGPTLETGADIVAKNANDDIVAMAKAGDKIKYYTMTLEMAKPDPQVEQIFCGGEMIETTTSALGEPGAQTIEGFTENGELPTATNEYRVSQYNAFGESKATSGVTVSNTGAGTGANSVIVGAPAALAIGQRVYGRAIGVPFLLGTVPNYGTTIAVKKTVAAKAWRLGEAKELEIEKVTKPIPVGSYFKVAGKSVYKTLTYIGLASGSVKVELVSEAESTVLTAAEVLKGVFWDQGGKKVPLGTAAPSETDTSGLTAENLGYKAPVLGIVGNTNGCSIEAWSYVYVEGAPPSELPFYWWVMPRIRFGHIQPRDLSNAAAVTIMEGIAIGNPNWASGPTGEWPEATLKATAAYQRIRCGAGMVPAVSYEPVIATV
jgi:hypothetical protein